MIFVGSKEDMDGSVCKWAIKVTMEMASRGICGQKRIVLSL